MAGRSQVSIRMYNVGFGDAFLVLIPAKDRQHRILFDCGVHQSCEKPHKIGDVVARIVQDVTDADGVPRIDVVVCSHRHQDHVLGFQDKAWAGVEVQEVWMPWIEDPADDVATDIRERQSKLALALQARLAADSVYQRFAWNSLTNEKAMATLHDGFRRNGRKAKRRFLPPPDRKEHTFETSALPGVTVHVLGPSRDPEIMKRMDPPAGKAWLRMVEAEGDEAGGRFLPFREKWTIDRATFEAQAGVQLDPDDLKAVREANSEMDGTLAAALEDAVNNTSLIIALEVGEACLLFPGDAQWGPWEAALKDPEWKRLLKKATFYKVGHHGSHNATPKDFVALAREDIISMVSWSPVEKWKQIPKKELLEALRQRSSRVILSHDDARSNWTNKKVFKLDDPDTPICFETHVPIE